MALLKEPEDTLLTTAAFQSKGHVPAHVPAHLIVYFDMYHDERVTDDVQGSYASILKNAPDVFYTPANGGHWMVRRFEAIADIVCDPEHFSVREMQIPRIPEPPFFIPLSLDPPRNLPYRQAMMPAFSQRAIRELEPAMRRWARHTIEPAVRRGRCDFVRDIASQFPVSVFMELMGMPLERLSEFRDLADAFLNARSAQDIGRLGGRIIALMTDLIELRRSQPGTDLISQLLKVQIEGRPITLEEMQALSFTLFLGGMDTVTNVLAFTYRALGADPLLQERLRGDISLVPRFVDEGLRCFGVTNVPRLVVRDCDRHGVPFRVGDMVLCLLPMGGRDDRANPDPGRFDIDRAKRTHISFSMGPHVCVGHILARTEMRILTEEWIQRIPRFSVDPGAVHGFRMGVVQALRSLPLSFTAEAT